MAPAGRMDKQGRRSLGTAGGARRVGGLAVAAALAGVGLTGTSVVLAGSAAEAGATSSQHTVHVSTAKVSNVGTVLTTSSGRTLYRFANDPAGAATCTGGCAKIWPPLLASKGAHIAGPKGVKGFSLIKVGNHWQVAFHHAALYRFTGDKKKGQAKGQSFNNAWFAVLKSGIPAASAPAATTTTQAPTTTTQAPHAATTTPPTSPTPVTQAPTPTTRTTSPPTTTPTTSPPPPTTTPTTTGGGGGVGF